MSSEKNRAGTAIAPVHHGEILQGVFAADGAFKKGLVTLPCDIYTGRARFTIDAEPAVSVYPRWKTKARRAAQLTVAMFQEHRGAVVGGRLEVLSEVPLSQGFGSSTSDVLAAIGAVADAFSAKLPAAAVAKLAVAAETASDSLMFEDSAVLFAHRAGEVIEDFGNYLPHVRVVGFVARPNKAGVDTLALPPARYSRREIEIFSELRSDLREAVGKNDVELLGRVATASTELNQRHLPVPGLSQIKAIGRAAGSVGVQVSHSGNIAGLLFDPWDRDAAQRVSYSRKMLGDVGFSEQWQFDSGSDRAALGQAGDVPISGGGHGTAQDHTTGRQLVRGSVSSHEALARSPYD